MQINDGTIARYKNVVFDDFVIEENGNAWSEICPECKKKYHLENDRISNNASDEMICGVEGCNNFAEFYIDFKIESWDETKRS